MLLKGNAFHALLLARAKESGWECRRPWSEARVVPVRAGWRRSAANLAVGGYRSLVILGRYETLPPHPKSQTEAEAAGLFGVELRYGPSEVRPGETTTAQLAVLVYDRGCERLKEVREFTLLEGWKIVGHGRVRDRT